MNKKSIIEQGMKCSLRLASVEPCVRKALRPLSLTHVQSCVFRLCLLSRHHFGVASIQQAGQKTQLMPAYANEQENKLIG